MTIGGQMRATRGAEPRRRVLLVAGEASGDLHGADLVAALRARVPDAEIYGVGGEHLREAGMTTLADTGEITTMGIVETVGRLRALVALYRRLVRELAETRPALCILIDFPEFNLRLARAAKSLGVPVLYYIGPQVWAWRRGRARKIAHLVDRLAVVFPFEPSLYAGHGGDVEFVGHPLLDRVRATRSREETLRAHGLDPDRRTVLVLPGSRAKEIDYILPELLGAVRILAAEGDRQFVLARATTVSAAQVTAELERAGVSMPVVAGETYDLMAAADLALVASGTATLECALLETPMVIVYRVSTLTAAVARVLVRGVRHVGMPNVIAGREVVPELLQEKATARGIAAAARTLLGDDRRLERVVSDLRNVRAQLGGGGAARRAAGIAAEMMEARA
jgi:lipid-A-disaccharide synthase